MKIELKVEGATPEQTLRYTEIVAALLYCGGLDGVKDGRTVIHFDKKARFRGVQLDYWPWKTRETLN